MLQVVAVALVVDAVALVEDEGAVVEVEVAGVHQEGVGALPVAVEAAEEASPSAVLPVDVAHAVPAAAAGAVAVEDEAART